MRKKANELQVGDEFTARGGPYSGLRVRVTAEAKAGPHSVYAVPVEVIDEVVVKIDFDQTVEVS